MTVLFHISRTKGIHVYRSVIGNTPMADFISFINSKDRNIEYMEYVYSITNTFVKDKKKKGLSYGHFLISLSLCMYASSTAHI